MIISSIAAGAIIGKGGETIADIQKTVRNILVLPGNSKIKQLIYKSLSFPFAKITFIITIT